MEKSKFEVFVESYRGVISEGVFETPFGNNVTLCELVSKTKFKPVDAVDKQGFAGIESSNAMIGEYGVILL